MKKINSTATAVGIDVKVLNLEEEIKTTNQRLDGYGNELKILLAEINVISDWIFERFGVELIDKSSFLFKHIHNYEEIEELASNISSLYTCNKNKVRVEGKPERKITKTNYNEDIDDDDIVCLVEACDSDEQPPKRKRGRPRKNPAKITIRKRGRPKKNEPNLDTGDNSEQEETAASTSDDTSKASSRGRRKRKVIQEKNNTLLEIETVLVQSQCDQCGKILKDPSSLRQHKLIHKNLRPHPCPVCGKCFRRKFHLKTHLLIHSGEKKHQCGYCGRLFLLPKDLIAHERIHTGERPYSCTTCTKSFNLKSHLTMHLRIHTGEKPYTCNICEKSFSQSNSLRVHKKIHLKDQKIHHPSHILHKDELEDHQRIITEELGPTQDAKVEFQSELANTEELSLSQNSIQTHGICINDNNHLVQNSHVSIGHMINALTVDKCEDYGGDGPPISIIIDQPLSLALSSNEHQHHQQQSTIDLQSIMMPSNTGSMMISGHSGIDQRSGNSLVLNQTGTQGNIGMMGSGSLFLGTRQPFIGQGTSFAIQPFHDPKMRYF